jgi:molybdopterin-binding protein
MRFCVDLETISVDSCPVDLVTPREAARRLGVSYPTIKQWIYKGLVRTRSTAGGHHRIPEAEVERLQATSGLPLPSRALRPAGTIVSLSGRNQLRGIIEEVRSEGLLAQVRLRLGDQTLTAVITRDAIDELKLRRGDEAIAVIKATEVMIARGLSESPPVRKSASGSRATTPRPARRRRP